MITGHSLGGAMAIHAAAHIQVFYYNKPFLLYTFGAPRVGDTRFFKFFKTIFKGTNYRITNYRDPVPHVPL
jgi:triacylglycerol lipase